MTISSVGFMSGKVLTSAKSLLVIPKSVGSGRDSRAARPTRPKDFHLAKVIAAHQHGQFLLAPLTLTIHTHPAAVNDINTIGRSPLLKDDFTRVKGLLGKSFPTCNNWSSVKPWNRCIFRKNIVRWVASISILF
jgi:hypothetical protein